MLMLRINKEMLFRVAGIKYVKRGTAKWGVTVVFFTSLKVENLRTEESKVKKQFLLS